MPSLPPYKKKKYVPKVVRDPGSNQDFYQSTTWRKVRGAYYKENPLCEFNKAEGRVVEGNVIDHIIPVDHGGAKYDERNFMCLHTDVHNRKSALEKHHGCLIASIGEDGEKVPRNREDIFEILKRD